MLSQNTNEFEKYKSMNFMVCGWPQRFRKRVQRMEVGDNIVVYNSTTKKFMGTTKIESNYYIKNEPYMESNDPQLNGYNYFIKTIQKNLKSHFC